MVKRAGVLLEPGEFPCNFFILRERVENAATYRGMLERVEDFEHFL
jgi:hypothetical protein